MTRRLSVHKAIWPLSAPFRITGYVFETTDTIEVQISDGTYVGRGEASGIYYTGDDVDKMIQDVERIRPDIESGMSRVELQSALPACGARNAIDCALWDLECQRTGKSIWELTGVELKPTQTVYTIGIEETPDLMADHAKRAAQYVHLKVKLDGVQPVERIAAIREARPDATIVIDANQGFTIEMLADVAPKLARLGVSMIEQPLPRGDDAALGGFASEVPICADESCLHLGELDTALARYDMINIKLDKCGGLTEALAIAQATRDAGKSLMVGNMMGTSLSTVPAFVVAQLCDFVDVDGPLGLRSDHLGGMQYDGTNVTPPNAKFWGNAHFQAAFEEA